MLERLDYVKLRPERILDAASGPAREAQALRERYPGARIIAADFSLPMLRDLRARWWRRTPARPVCADMASLPFAPSSFQLVWCNMGLHWASDPAPVLKEFARVLAPDGLLMFSTLGPDSLKELRAAAGAQRVHGFHDMHDIGDMVVAAGLAAPVIDMEMLTFAYRNSDALLADLQASGQTNARADRRRGLDGSRFRERLRVTLEPRATFEVVYGHAWKGRARETREPAVKTIDIFKRIP